jgi:hypothetical protein
MKFIYAQNNGEMLQHNIIIFKYIESFASLRLWLNFFEFLDGLNYDLISFFILILYEFLFQTMQKVFY